MIRNLFLTALMFISSILYAQLDSLSQDSILQNNVMLQTVEKIGIRNSNQEPSTQSSIKTDSLILQGGDPFFIISKYSPGSFSQSDNGSYYGYSYMRIRGIDQTKINFNLNGIPLNEMEDQGIYFSNMPGFYNNISEINVNRGVGFSKYGVSSMGGTVNLLTQSPLIKKNTMSIGQGSFDSKAISVKTSSGFIGKSRLAHISNFSFINSNGFRDHSGTNGFNYFGDLSYFGDKNIFKIYGFTGLVKNQLSWQPIPMKNYNVYYTDYVNVYDSVNYVQKGYNSNYKENSNGLSEKDRFNQNFVSLNWVNFKRFNFKTNTSVYFSNVNGSYTTREPQVGNPDYANILYFRGDTITTYLPEIIKYNLNSYQYGAMTNLVKSFGGFKLNVGANYNDYERIHSSSFYDRNTDSLFYKNRGFKRDIIGYSKIQYNCNKVDYFLDIQYRGVDFKYVDPNGNYINHSWNFFNPKIGLKFSPDSLNTFWTSLSKSSRESTRSDMFIGYDNVFIKGDSVMTTYGDKVFSVDYTPETMYDFEIGHKYKSKDFLLSYNYYYMISNNERVPYGVYNMIGMPLKSRVDRVDRTGIEVEVLYKMGNVKLGSNGSYSFNKIKYYSIDSVDYNNITPFNTPNILMNNFASIGNEWISISVNGSYISKIYLDNTQRDNFTSPGYYLVGSSISITGDLLSFSFTVNNLLNKYYYLPGGVINNPTPSGVDQIPGYYSGASRNCFLRATLNL